jgi:hypothetical protein
MKMPSPTPDWLSEKAMACFLLKLSEMATIHDV